MIEKDDDILVEEVLKGNLRSFEVLIKKYQGVIYRYSCKTLNDPEEAKDVTQVVFIKAYEKLGSFDFKYRFFSWIYRIAVNECINHRSSRKLFEKFDDQVSGNNTPAQILEQKEVAEKVGYALSLLNPDYRSLIVLKHYENLSYQEISVITGVPEKKVKSRLYMARQILKNILIENSED